MSCRSRCPSPDRRRWLFGGLLWAGGAAGAVSPAPVEVSAHLGAPRPQGRGTFRWWGLALYEATLWVVQPLAPDRYVDAPFALQLQYARSLQGRQIAERSVVEMQRLGDVPPARAERWRAALREAFPDVAPGDRLVGLHHPGDATRFCHNGRPTATIEDTAFAPQFFGLWLSSRSPAPALREALYGHGR